MNDVISVSPVDLADVDEHRFRDSYVGCIILTRHHEILLQQRGVDWHRFPGYLSEFGGRIEASENPMQALIRELQEELGANVHADQVVYLGAITEEMMQHSELIYGYFWHDVQSTMTGCYEGEARYFDNIEMVLKHPKVMDSVKWWLLKCQEYKLLK